MEDIQGLVFFAMIFCHIVDDYYSQGILANLKMKSWWKKNYPDKMYKNDWIMALIMHTMSWSFMILIPPTVYNLIFGRFNIYVYTFAFFINSGIHFAVDHLKANKKVLNLISDQLCHIAQIIVTCLIMLYA